jgi:hypothetical protein
MKRISSYSGRIPALVAMALACLVAVSSSSALASLGTVPDTSYQTNGTVRVVVRAGGVVYVGGSFTSVRPAGSAVGTNESQRNDLAAFDAHTGALLAWNPDANGEVHALAVAPSGSTIFAGGDFTTVGGVSHAYLVALPTTSPADTSPGTPLSWPGNTDGGVRALATLSGRLFVGGDFMNVDGVHRRYLAAVSISSGQLLAWAASPNAVVDALLVSPGGQRVFVGGAFSMIGAQSQHRLAALSALTGVPTLWAFHPGFEVLGLAEDASSLYVASGGPGGYASAYSLATGARRWVEFLDGNATGVAVYHGQVIVIGHFRNARTPTGWQVRNHLAAFDAPTGALLSWAPSLDQVLGGFATLAYGQHLYIAGDFTRIDNQPQQSFAGFADTIADTTPPVITKPPTIAIAASGTIGATVPAVVSWAASDSPAGVCRYLPQQSAAGATFTPVVPAFFTAQSILSNLAPSTSYRYQLAVQDCEDNQTPTVLGSAGTIGILQNSSYAFRYAGAWVRNARISGASGGTLSYTGQRGASVSGHFIARQVVWVGSRTPLRGQATVYLDGHKVAIVNLYSPTTTRRQIVFSHTWPTDTQHTITIVCNATAGHPLIDVDALALLR